MAQEETKGARPPSRFWGRRYWECCGHATAFLPGSHASLLRHARHGLARSKAVAPPAPKTAPQHTTPSFHPVWVLLILVCITGYAIFLRTWGLADECPWFDEVITLEHLDAPNLSTFIERIAPAGTPPMPAYFTLEYLWGRWVGRSVATVRMLSVLLNLAAIPLIYLLGRRLCGTAPGLIAAFCFAASLVHVYFAQEIRMYAQIPLLTALSAMAFWEGVQGGKRPWWVLNAFCNALLLWTHLFNVFFLGVQALFLILFRRDRRGLLAGWGTVHAILGGLFLMWFLSLNLGRVSQVAECIPSASLKDAAMAVLVFAGGRASNENPLTHLPFALSLDVVLGAVMVLLALWGMGRTVCEKRGEEASNSIERAAFLMLWLVVPPVTLLAVSWFIRPVFLYRYVLYSSIPLYIFAGQGVAGLRSRGGQGVMAIVLAGLFMYQGSAVFVGPFRPDWKSAGAHVAEQMDEGDVVLCYQSVNTLALRYNSAIPDDAIETVDVWSAIPEAVSEASEEGRGVWLFVWLWSDPANFERELGARRITYDTADFAGWPLLRVYEVSGSQT